MASLVGVNTSVSSAVDIPEFWDKYVIQLLESNLVADKVMMDFSYKIKGGGDTIHIPTNQILQTAATFTEGNRLTDKLQANTETTKDISVATHKVNPFVISKRLDAQSIYDEKALKFKKAAYAVAKAFDSAMLALAVSSHPTVNSGGSTITNLDVTECWTRLNDHDVPASDRAWVFNPWCVKDLYDLTGNYFTSMDWTSEKPLTNGQMPKMLLGSPVYISTNVAQTAAGSPAQNLMNNLYIHKEAVGFAANFRDATEYEYDMDIQGYLGNVGSLYGGVLLDGYKTITLNRQSSSA